MTAWTPDLGTDDRRALLAAVPATRVGLDGLPVPLLRGRLHQGAVVPTATVGVAGMLLASGLAARAAVGIFTVSILAMLTASAVYHCHCSTHEMRVAARRVDHATILVAIAGTQTAFWILVGPEPLAHLAISGVWLVAGIGFVYKILRLEETRSNGSWLFVALGWSGVALIPSLLASGTLVAALVVLGGGAYSVGGVLLFTRRGNLWPGVAGYHEVWHALTIVGYLCHGIAIGVLTAA